MEIVDIKNILKSETIRMNGTAILCKFQEEVDYIKKKLIGLDIIIISDPPVGRHLILSIVPCSAVDKIVMEYHKKENKNESA